MYLWNYGYRIVYDVEVINIEEHTGIFVGHVWDPPLSQIFVIVTNSCFIHLGKAGRPTTLDFPNTM